MEIPVVQEQVIVQAISEVVDSLPPVEEFTEPGFNQVHHEQIAAIPVVTEYFPMTDDEGVELSAGVRPAPLEEGRLQGKLQRHAGIGYELVQALDAPVLQMVEQLPDVHLFFATCLPVVAEQVIDVPKIILENIPSRRLCRDTQLAEQLVEVPTIVSYSLLQRNMEHNVDIPVPGGGGGRRGRKRRTRLWPKLERRPGQGSTAFHGEEHQEEESEEELHEYIEYFKYHGRLWGPLGSGLASMSAGGWLRQTDPRLAPQSGGRRGFYVKENSDPEVVGTLFLRADRKLTCPLLCTSGVLVQTVSSGQGFDMPVVLATGAVLGQGCCFPVVFAATEIGTHSANCAEDADSIAQFLERQLTRPLFFNDRRRACFSQC